MAKGAYTKPGRLSDVLALIQVLALDKHTYRSTSGIAVELQGNPASSDTWITLAKEHPEFFRVREEAANPLSLVARHVLPNDATGGREIPPELIRTLIQVAIELHDRQVSAAEWWWKYLTPLWPALVGGIFGTVSTLVTIWFKGYPK